MAIVTRRIGLSLGADICWPICYEQIMRRLELAIPSGRDELRFEVERVAIEPFSLRHPRRYDVVIDRLTHWFHTSREWIKKSTILDGLYVFNNPWTVQSMQKLTTYCAMIRLGMPIPETWLIPPKSHEPSADLRPTLEAYARLFDLAKIGESLGYPLFMKPYDGGAWKGVSRIDSRETLEKAYEESGTMVMHLQAAVEPFDLFVRCIGLGPQVNVVQYEPDKPHHERYVVAFDVVDGDEWSLLRDTALTINTFFGWDFNSCECLRRDGTFYPIDFANPCPDSQVTSLHYHFPWIVKANIRWSVFCAATRRAMRLTPDWEPYFRIADMDLPYREKLRRYAEHAETILDQERFLEFCERHLAHLDEVALEFFGSDIARDAVRQKVVAVFPEHEWDRFTDHFWGLIEFWCRTERDRLDGRSGPGRDAP